MKLRKQMLGKLLAANISNQLAVVTPYKLEKYENTWHISFYWWKGPTKSSCNAEDFDVLQIYGTSKNKSGEWFDKVEVHFINTYTPVKPIEPAPARFPDGFYGWIAPNGDYYSVESGDHDATASAIVACLEKRYLPGYEAREYLRKTWLVLMPPRHVIGRSDTSLLEDYTITEAQLATIEKINKEHSQQFNYGSRTLVDADGNELRELPDMEATSAITLETPGR